MSIIRLWGTIIERMEPKVLGKSGAAKRCSNSHRNLLLLCLTPMIKGDRRSPDTIKCNQIRLINSTLVINRSIQTFKLLLDTKRPTNKITFLIISSQISCLPNSRDSCHLLNKLSACPCSASSSVVRRSSPPTWLWRISSQRCAKSRRFPLLNLVYLH